MKTKQNYSIDELAELLFKATTEETFLKKEVLIPKYKVLIKQMVDLKNSPKNYNAYESPNTAARRLRTIEQKDQEIIFWRDIVKGLDGENIQKYYAAQEEMLIAKGFLNKKSA